MFMHMVTDNKTPHNLEGEMFSSSTDSQKDGYVNIAEVTFPSNSYETGIFFLVL